MDKFFEETLIGNHRMFTPLPDGQGRAAFEQSPHMPRYGMGQAESGWARGDAGYTPERNRGVEAMWVTASDLENMITGQDLQSNGYMLRNGDSTLPAYTVLEMRKGASGRPIETDPLWQRYQKEKVYEPHVVFDPVSKELFLQDPSRELRITDPSFQQVEHNTRSRSRTHSGVEKIPGLNVNGLPGGSKVLIAEIEIGGTQFQPTPKEMHYPLSNRPQMPYARPPVPVHGEVLRRGDSHYQPEETRPSNKMLKALSAGALGAVLAYSAYVVGTDGDKMGAQFARESVVGQALGLDQSVPENRQSPAEKKEAAPVIEGYAYNPEGMNKLPTGTVNIQRKINFAIQYDAATSKAYGERDGGWFPPAQDDQNAGNYVISVNKDLNIYVDATDSRAVKVEADPDNPSISVVTINKDWLVLHAEWAETSTTDEEQELEFIAEPIDIKGHKKALDDLLEDSQASESDSLEEETTETADQEQAQEQLESSLIPPQSKQINEYITGEPNPGADAKYSPQIIDDIYDQMWTEIYQNLDKQLTDVLGEVFTTTLKQHIQQQAQVQAKQVRFADDIGEIQPSLPGFLKAEGLKLEKDEVSTQIKGSDVRTNSLYTDAVITPITGEKE